MSPQNHPDGSIFDRRADAQDQNLGHGLPEAEGGQADSASAEPWSGAGEIEKYTDEKDGGGSPDFKRNHFNGPGATKPFTILLKKKPITVTKVPVKAPPVIWTAPKPKSQGSEESCPNCGSAIEVIQHSALKWQQLCNSCGLAGPRKMCKEYAILSFNNHCRR